MLISACKVERWREINKNFDINTYVEIAKNFKPVHGQVNGQSKLVTNKTYPNENWIDTPHFHFEQFNSEEQVSNGSFLW